MKKNTTRFFFINFIFAAMLMGNSSAYATVIRISQETAAGVGDFDSNILGTIQTYSTTLTTSSFYQFGSPDSSSYNGDLNGGPATQSNLAQIFFLEAADGLSMVSVLDQYQDGSGGKIVESWALSGDTASYLVKDDSGEGTVSGGGTLFSMTHNWINCCTDGFAIGSLDNNWELIGGYSLIQGIDAWQATSSLIGDNVNLSLATDLRVRFDIAPEEVSEPATLALMGLGLLGIAGLRRKQ